MNYDLNAELTQLEAIRQEMEASNALLAELDEAVSIHGPAPLGITEQQLSELFALEALQPLPSPTAIASKTLGVRC